MSDSVHRLRITTYPWTDQWANNNWVDDLWLEDDAKDILDGQKVRIHPTPRGVTIPASYKGDKGVKTLWKWAEVLTGPCQGDFLWVASIWFDVGIAQTKQQRCNCPTRLLMTSGCKCGGI